MVPNFDNEALMKQLGGMKDRAPGLGTELGARGGGLPTSSTLPIREAPIATPLPAPPTSEEAPTQPLDVAPPIAAQAPTQPMTDQVTPSPDFGVGALAGLLKRPPMPQEAIQNVGQALKPQNVLNALKPRNVGNALRNPLVALGGLFGRRR
jgi:hypothetical protein